MSSLLKKMLMVSVVLCVVGMFCNASFAVSEDEAAKIEQACPDKAVATPKKARKMLIFTKCNGSVHSSIPYVTKALEVMGKKTGAYETVVSDDMSVFSAENLAQFDAICFNNTTALKPDEQQQKAILDFINNGKGIVGIHAATDNFYDWPAGGELMGGFFSGHPWHSGGTWAFKIDDPSHPLNASFEGKGFSLSDEIYLIREVGLRDTARILISLDYSDEATRTVKGAKPEYKDDPISWVKSVGKGRLFYCSFGHNHHILWNSAILKHYLAGIQFALGDNDVDTTPTNLKTCKLDSILGNVVKYDYGQSRETLTDLADFVRKSYPYVKLRKEVEQKLVAALINKDATFAAKQFICRQLRLIGSDISVPILAKMLVDDKTSDIARYALEPIEGALVDQTLLDAIDKTSGKTKTGIINTIGVRADAKAVSKLSSFVNDSDKMIASAAITALGNIGTNKAAGVLAKAAKKVDDGLVDIVLDAYLKCADKMTEAGENRQATKIYKNIYESDNSIAIRTAALRGMVSTASSKDAVKIIVDVLNDSDVKMQTVAIGLAGEIEGTAATKALAKNFGRLSSSGKVQMLSALAGRGDSAALPQVVKAVKSEDQAVKVAALKALRDMGDASVVTLLAEAAADTKGEVRQQARGSLYRLRGDEIDPAIVGAIDSADAAVKVELIKAAGERHNSKAVAALLKTTKDADRKVRVESIKVLRDIAGAKDLAGLVDVLVNTQSLTELKAAEKAVATVAAKADKSKATEIVLSACLSAKDKKIKGSLMELLGSIGDDKALPLLDGALTDSDADIKASAIRALSNWPNDKPINDLLAIAKGSDNNTHRVLALRGFVRLIGFTKGNDKVELYQQAINLATNSNEKRLVLSELAAVKSYAGLKMAATYLDDDELKQEAEVAIVKIAEGIFGSCPQTSKEILSKIISTTSNDSVKKQATGIINQINKFGDFITAWQVSGPYMRQNVLGPELFDTQFAPEKAETDAKWGILPASEDSGKPWLIQLERIFGGDNRVAYVRNKVWSDKDQQVRLEVGSDDGIKVWLNGEVVHANNAARGIKPGDDKVKVNLKKGWNEMMMKITQGGGGWGACAKFRTVDGGDIKGLKFQIEE